jgi:hypothetical protein
MAPSTPTSGQRAGAGVRATHELPDDPTHGVAAQMPSAAFIHPSPNPSPNPSRSPDLRAADVNQLTRTGTRRAIPW